MMRNAFLQTAFMCKLEHTSVSTHMHTPKGVQVRGDDICVSSVSETGGCAAERRMSTEAILHAFNISHTLSEEIPVT